MRSFKYNVEHKQRFHCVFYFTSFFVLFFAFRFCHIFQLRKVKKKKDNTQPVCYELSESETVSTNEMFQFAVSFYVDS